MENKGTKKIFNLSIDDSNFLRGIAVILLLLHHLFYVRQELYDDVVLFGNHNLVNEIGLFGKSCVAIFVFLSGYGLQKVNSVKNDSLSNYYIHRFTKLYTNFWLIWLLFVPISIFCFGRSLNDAYGGSFTIGKMFMDFGGVLNIFGLYGYNPTWWFYSTIIILYLLFPLLKKFLRFPLLLVFWGIGAYYLSNLNSVFFYLLPFCLGMVFADNSNIIKMPEFTPKNYWWLSDFFLMIIFWVILFMERIKSRDQILYDNFITLVLVMGYKTIYIPKDIKKIFVFLGKHSMNIFLFHTFIFLYWFKDYIYYSRNPFIIFVSLLVPCLLISVLIEKLKQIIHFKTLNEKIELFLCRIIKK